MRYFRRSDSKGLRTSGSLGRLPRRLPAGRQGPRSAQSSWVQGSKTFWTQVWQLLPAAPAGSPIFRRTAAPRSLPRTAAARIPPAGTCMHATQLGPDDTKHCASAPLADNAS